MHMFGRFVFLRRLQKECIVAFPGLTLAALRKCPPTSAATPKGHLKQKRKNLCTTQPKGHAVLPHHSTPPMNPFPLPFPTASALTKSVPQSSIAPPPDRFAATKPAAFPSLLAPATTAFLSSVTVTAIASTPFPSLTDKPNDTHSFQSLLEPSRLSWLLPFTLSPRQ